MEMDYLPLGKQGCIECFELSYYCNECTAAILEHVYAESRPTTHEADRLSAEDRAAIAHHVMFPND